MSGSETVSDPGNIATLPFTRDRLRALAVSELIAAATDVGGSVVEGTAQPTGGAEMPVIFVQVPHERKVVLAERSMPRFNAVMALVLVCRSAAVDVPTLEAAMDRLINQVHQAILTSYNLLSARGAPIQQYLEVETEQVIDTKGRAPVAEAKITFLCEVYQAYSPAPGPLITTIGLSLNSPSNGAAGGTLALADTAIVPPSP